MLHQRQSPDASGFLQQEEKTMLNNLSILCSLDNRQSEKQILSTSSHHPLPTYTHIHTYTLILIFLGLNLLNTFFNYYNIMMMMMMMIMIIIIIIIIMRFSPVLLGLVCNCHVSATSRSLETQHFPQYVSLFQGWPTTVYLQRCQECLTFHARIWRSSRLSQVYQSLLVLLSLWMFCGFS